MYHLPSKASMLFIGNVWTSDCFIEFWRKKVAGDIGDKLPFGKCRFCLCFFWRMVSLLFLSYFHICQNIYIQTCYTYTFLYWIHVYYIISKYYISVYIYIYLYVTHKYNMYHITGSIILRSYSITLISIYAYLYISIYAYLYISIYNNDIDCIINRFQPRHRIRRKFWAAGMPGPSCRCVRSRLDFCCDWDMSTINVHHN